METKYKFRRLNTDRGPHHPDPSLSSGVEGEEHTAHRPNGLCESARVRAAREAYKVMLSYHLKEAKRYEQEIADLEAQVNSKT